MKFLPFLLALAAVTLLQAADAPLEKEVSDLIAGPQVTVVHFWAPWCPNCRAEMDPAEGWARFVAANPEVKVVFINIWHKGQSPKPPLEAAGLGAQPNLVLLDHPNRSRLEADRLNTFLGLPVTWIPTTWVYREGKLRAAFNYGEIRFPILQQLVDDARNEWKESQAMKQHVQSLEESAKANKFLDRVFDDGVARSPITQGYLGLKKDNDKWDDVSEARRLEDFVITVQQLGELKSTIDFNRLDEQTQMSYRLFVVQCEHAIEGWKWRNHDYVFTQMSGMHTDVPAFLINFHPVDNGADARAYIARLRGLPKLFDQLIVRAESAAARGILPPKFVFPILVESSREVITGAPFTASGTRCALFEDFETKVGALKDVDEATKQQLIANARAALLEAVKPAYEKLIMMFEAQGRAATDDDGVWKLPEGRDYYSYRLRAQTTTALTPDEVHEIGLREVARIHAGMTAIKEQVGFKGDLAAFLKFTRDDPQFSYPTTEEGKAAYIKRAMAIIDTMRARLDEFFGVKPKAALVVKKVEPFREKGSAGAFYDQPSADGSRPGSYYINTIDMRGLPIWEMETLAHHEAIPGHHMQIAIAQELENMPKFRMFGGYNAYAEGWALYAEYFPKEFGFYQDPYQDFGRLADELLRSVRLVVDTGVHARKWTRQQVMDYFRANTPQSDRDTITETNRYIVWPGQACGYKIGMLKILELRERAKQGLGPKFDLRGFHDVVLKNGALPLNLLEENVVAWIAKRKR